MHPELITIPGINLVIQSYGFMMVLGFIFGGLLARKNARAEGQDPENISNLLVIAMIGGVFGARLFHVIHFWNNYQDDLLGIFKIWEGGLEFLGGVIAAYISMLTYAIRKKMPLRMYMDFLGPALMLGLAFGRVGCLLNGCCYGKTCDHPWGITFPSINNITELGPQGGPTIRYSFPYSNQLHHDFDRNSGPEVELPNEYYSGYGNGDGYYVNDLNEVAPEYKDGFYKIPIPAPELPEKLVDELRDNHYPMKKVHPTQIYSSINASIICLILQFVYSRRKIAGHTFSLMLVLYGITRFIIEGLRADSPLEFTGFTISQNLSILAVVGGIVLAVIFWKFPLYYNTQPKNGEDNGKS